MGNIEPLLGITKPAEGLNKPCQGNVNGRKPFAAEGFNVKIPFISQTYTKAVAISYRQSHTKTRNLVKYHPRVVFTESFHAMVSTDEEVCWIQGHCTGILKIYAKISIIQALMWTSSQKQDWIVQTKILCHHSEVVPSIQQKTFRPWISSLQKHKWCWVRLVTIPHVTIICIPLPKSTSESNVSGIDANFDFVSWLLYLYSWFSHDVIKIKKIRNYQSFWDLSLASY